eukprot:TRINITY_DN6462_c0_g2_i18.p1 TRINITY_DN6462_c0_g2~~TRINITY_DN6462_c0_g2_i18.p1  ORF type:complete len:344 (-),score=54.80 TRINITY_DN6462_c0_g2_i18:387-1358(-)
MGQQETTQSKQTTEHDLVGPSFNTAERLANWSYDKFSGASHSALGLAISFADRACEVSWINDSLTSLLGEKREHLQLFLRLLLNYVQDIPPTELVIGWFILENNLRIPFPVSNNSVDLEDLIRVTYWSKFTLAAYGWKLIQSFVVSDLLGVAKGVGDSLLSKEREIQHNEHSYQLITGLPVETLIHTDWFSAHMSPAHLIALDVSHKAIVVSIRGTMDITNDVLADVVCATTVWEGLHTHMGFTECAQNKFYATHLIVKKLHDEHPNFTVIITGHSLGAAVCVLYGFLMRKTYPDMNIYIYALACPPVLSLEEARNAVSWVEN